MKKSIFKLFKRTTVSTHSQIAEHLLRRTGDIIA